MLWCIIRDLYCTCTLPFFWTYCVENKKRATRSTSALCLCNFLFFFLHLRIPLDRYSVILPLSPNKRDALHMRGEKQRRSWWWWKAKAPLPSYKKQNKKHGKEQRKRREKKRERRLSHASIASPYRRSSTHAQPKQNKEEERKKNVWIGTRNNTKTRHKLCLQQLRCWARMHRRW